MLEGLTRACYKIAERRIVDEEQRRSEWEQERRQQCTNVALPTRIHRFLNSIAGLLASSQPISELWRAGTHLGQSWCWFPLDNLGEDAGCNGLLDAQGSSLYEHPHDNLELYGISSFQIMSCIIARLPSTSIALTLKADTRGLYRLSSALAP